MSVGEHSVAAVLVDYRAGESVRIAIDSLLTGSLVPGHIVVVDNAQAGYDYRTERLAETSTELHVVEPEQNLGFAEGCNVGARVARKLGVELLAFVNPDVIVAPTGLGSLVQFLGDSRWTAVAGVLRHGGFDGQPFLGGRTRFSKRTGKVWQEHDPLPAPTVVVPYLHGAFFVVSASEFFEVQGMDENFFLYREEVDFFLRLDRRFPRSIAMIDKVVAEHSGGVTTGSVASPLRVGFMSRNYQLLRRAHAGYWSPLWYLRWVSVETLGIAMSKGLAAAIHHVRAFHSQSVSGVELAHRWSAAR